MAGVSLGLIYIIPGMYYLVWVAGQQFHGKGSLTYSSAHKLKAGQIVSVALQRRAVLGIIAAATTKPSFATKAILHDWPYTIPAPTLKLMEWLMQYYPAPLGTITELFTPPVLSKKLPPMPIAANTLKVPA